ncbi:MAG: S8 family serine peptidase [Acidobacteria bacterium]|nr:S8 family serine peptidase [Acidobacteriota bacterium]
MDPASPPLAVDPGPASTRPLDGRFADLGRKQPGKLLRLLVDLREQVDLDALMASQARRGLGRLESRAETLAALDGVAGRGRGALEPLLEELRDAGAIEYYRFLRFRNRVFVSALPAALEPLRQAAPVAELIPEYDSVRDKTRPAASGLQIAPPVPPGDSWGVEALQLRELWGAGIDGRGVVVGILDSGVIGEHAALAGGMVDGRGWYAPVNGEPEPIDTKPHGSAVLSCAVGRTVDGHALGAAPGARWAAALSNVFNSYNNVNMSLAADWLLFEVRPDVLLGAWGHGTRSCDPRDLPMLAAFRAAGTVPVFAAGNDGPEPGTAQAPISLRLGSSGVLSVAAVDRLLNVIPYSSRGPSACGRPGVVPDIAAPGMDLPAPTAGSPTSLTLVSGTSFAVGWVGGTVALVLQVRPEIPVAEVEDIIRRTALDLPPDGPDDDSGYGLVDPAAAVEAARAWKPRSADRDR